jgi:hypothetical protein
MAKVRLTTDLSKFECLERLRKVAGPDSARGWFDVSFPAVGDPIFIWVRGDRIKLAKASGDPRRNSFLRLFDARVLERRSGALIEGRFRMQWFVAASLTLWFCACVSVIGLVTLSIVSRAAGHPVGPRLNTSGPILLVPPAMLLAAFVLVRSGIRMARRGEEEVVHFLRTTLHADVARP